jgi:hypothetical protein
MALSASCIWEIRPSTGNATNPGGFALAGNTYSITNLTGTNANTSSPVVASVSYNFVAGDVGHYVYIASGTNWTPGLYQIASVAANAATLTAPSTGCATTASPTGGSATIDRTQVSAGFIVFNGSTITGSTGGTAAVVTLSGYTVVAVDVGNTVLISGGSNFTAGTYQITAVNTGSNTWTLDRNCCSGAASGMTGRMGGSAIAITGPMGAVNANGAGGNKFFVKAETTITTTASIALNAPAIAPANTVMPNRLIGYTTTRGDNGKVTIALSTNTGLVGLNITTNGWIVENFTINCAGLGTSTGIAITTNYNTIRNCLIYAFTSAGISLITSPTSSLITNCEVTGGTAAATAAISSTASNAGSIFFCNIHDNACPGIALGQFITIAWNLVVNNTGASSDGIVVGSGTVANGFIFNNTIYGSGREGIWYLSSQGPFRANIARNNLLVNNAGYGIRIGPNSGTQNGTPADPLWDGNCYYNNGTGTRLNMDDQGTQNPVNMVGTYTNVLDQIPTSSPFVRVTAVATDLAIDASVNTKVTSGSYSFVSSDVGETIYITSNSSGWVMGQYTIASVSGGAAILSTSPGATSSSSGSWYFNDFRLNVVSTGPLARGTGSPGAIAGISQTGALDMGCLQHVDASHGVIAGVVSPRTHQSYLS